jgi:hypothetical protein
MGDFIERVIADLFGMALTYFIISRFYVIEMTRKSRIRTFVKRHRGEEKTTVRFNGRRGEENEYAKYLEEAGFEEK